MAGLVCGMQELQGSKEGALQMSMLEKLELPKIAKCILGAMRADT